MAEKMNLLKLTVIINVNDKRKKSISYTLHTPPTEISMFHPKGSAV